MDNENRRQQASVRARAHTAAAFSIEGEARKLSAVYQSL